MDLKKRTNYSSDEKKHLLQLIAKYDKDLNTKKTGAYFIQKKNEAWLKVTNEYNSFTSVKRTQAQLRHLYDNLKHYVRKAAASELAKQEYLALLKENMDTSEVDGKIKDFRSELSDEEKELSKSSRDRCSMISNEEDKSFTGLLDSPLCRDASPYDDGPKYFGDSMIEVPCEVLCTPIIPLAEEPSTSEKSIKLTNTSRRRRLKTYKMKIAEKYKLHYYKSMIELTKQQKKNELQKFELGQLQLQKEKIQLKLLEKQLAEIKHSNDIDVITSCTDS